MRLFVPDRFSVLRVLKDQTDSRTLVAADQVLGRTDVVVKILRKRSLKRTQIEQFSWFAGVRHQNLSTVFDTGVTLNGDVYYVREYLPNSELLSIDSLSVVKALVSAVDFFQSNGLVHGGIKPSNIFADRAGLKITDPNFTANEGATDEDDIRFSAPEVLRDESRTLESDLYSLGAVLYRVITRRNLFEDVSLFNLKTKHIWASPLPIGNLGDVPKPIADLVFELLAKDPQQRVQAFNSLKERLAPVLTSVDRAPFVGRHDLLNEMLTRLHEGESQGLRVVLIEGPPGIGKSRFIEELRVRSSLGGLVFLKSSCRGNSDDLGVVRQLMVSLHANRHDHHNSKRRSAGAPLDLTAADSSYYSNEAKRDSLVERLISDLLTTVAFLGRRSSVILVIEDIDRADAPTIRFLQRLATRAVEGRLVLILTQRNIQGARPLSKIADYLPADLLRVRMPPLNEKESRDLTRFFKSSLDGYPDLFQMSRGNPRLIEYYAADDSTSAQKRADGELQWLVSQIPQQAVSLARALCVFARSVGPEVVAQVADLSADDLQSQIPILEDLGVITQHGPAVEIAYPALAKLIYETIPHKNRANLIKRRLELVHPRDTDLDHVAYCLFEANMFGQAGTFYQQLAEAAYDQQDYRNALIWYEKQEECAQRGRFEFAQRDRVNLSRCYQWTGQQLRARLVCEKLLSEEAVRNDPELLSEVYARLASIYDKTLAQERVKLAHAAVECLPSTSPKLCLRHVVLASRLMEVGNISGAAHVLETAKSYAQTDKDLAALALGRGSLSINMGDFRTASDCLLRVDPKTSTWALVLSNLAVSFENLGDLTRAWDNQSESYRLATAHRLVPIKIMSANNLASIKGKLGDLREAGRLFEMALALIEDSRKTDPALDMARLLSVYCDTALHNVQIGKYRRAAECIKHARPAIGSTYEFDRVYCRLGQCVFHLELGNDNKVRSILAQLHDSQTFKTPFFSVEHALILANMANASREEDLRRLQYALVTTREMGTRYQECRVLNELAAILVSSSRTIEAKDYAKTALGLAESQGYKPLATKALLLLGVACDDSTDKVHNLVNAFQNASEMGLPELVAESACHLGIHYLELGNLVTAREYLLRSVSTTESLVGELPVRLRRKYLAKRWRQQAREGFDRCNIVMQQQGIYVQGTGPGDDRYFKATYRLALAAAAVKSTVALLSLIEETLSTSSERVAIISLKEGAETFVRGIRMKVSAEVSQRILDVVRMAKDRMYFGCPDMARPKETVAWVPLRSETREGGIYVVCRQNEAPLTEKEMELLAIIGTIANGALRGLETNHDGEFENAQLAEFHGMIGASKAIRDIYAKIQIAARNTATVLIEGESGTGKELVARAIHAAGPRAKEPFIAVDCGAIPEALIEAELFGAKKGSYTGAAADRPGLFEAADRGTIFLDEISNTTPALQAKLLRVIQEREVRRIGETRNRRIDVRLIVATNANLEKLVNEGRFRKDLFYRLKVLYIKTPPLRSRRDDIPMLAQGFLQKLNAANGLKKYFGPGVLNHLSIQTFPGNVRELQNAIERAFFSAKGGAITEVPLENQLQSPGDADEVTSWFKELSEGRKDFWSAIHNRYKRRDISREKILALVDLGLRSTRGSYKNLASTFHLKERDYRRFMDFLRRNECLLDFRPYRKGADDTQ